MKHVDVKQIKKVNVQDIQGKDISIIFQIMQKEKINT
jgi:hypothetical protein